MCTILLRLDPDAAEPVVLAANRDEFRARPADPPGPIAPGIYAGRDRQAGGTWLAVGPGGLAALTNIGGRPPRPDAPSRGQLPIAALQGTLPDDLRPWNAFNLLVVDASGARVWSNDGSGHVVGPVALAPGMHVIENTLFGEASARATHAANVLAAADVGAGPGVAELASHHGGEEDRGLCHHGDAYGTVSASVIALGPALSVRRHLFVDGMPCRAPVADVTDDARRVTGAPPRR